jgi:hypothetical protein
MQPNNPKLLQEAGRTWETLAGWVCALISIAFSALLVFLAYIVAWRNPRQYGTHDLLKPETLLIFATLLAIAVGFSVFAFRLLQKKGPKRRLMSALVLKVWGTFFAIGSTIGLIDCVANHRWQQLPQIWEYLASSISMAVAAFALAKIWKDNDRVQPTTGANSPEQSPSNAKKISPQPVGRVRSVLLKIALATALLVAAIFSFDCMIHHSIFQFLIQLEWYFLMSTWVLLGFLLAVLLGELRDLVLPASRAWSDSEHFDFIVIFCIFVYCLMPVFYFVMVFSMIHNYGSPGE